MIHKKEIDDLIKRIKVLTKSNKRNHGLLVKLFRKEIKKTKGKKCQR